MCEWESGARDVIVCRQYKSPFFICILYTHFTRIFPIASCYFHLIIRETKTNETHPKKTKFKYSVLIPLKQRMREVSTANTYVVNVAISTFLIKSQELAIII